MLPKEHTMLPKEIQSITVRYPVPEDVFGCTFLCSNSHLTMNNSSLLFVVTE